MVDDGYSMVNKLVRTVKRSAFHRAVVLGLPNCPSKPKLSGGNTWDRRRGTRWLHVIVGCAAREKGEKQQKGKKTREKYGKNFNDSETTATRSRIEDVVGIGSGPLDKRNPKSRAATASASAASSEVCRLWITVVVATETNQLVDISKNEPSQNKKVIEKY